MAIFLPVTEPSSPMPVICRVNSSDMTKLTSETETIAANRYRFMSRSWVLPSSRVQPRTGRRGLLNEFRLDAQLAQSVARGWSKYKRFLIKSWNMPSPYPTLPGGGIKILEGG